jgi:hypothetical protein
MGLNQLFDDTDTAPVEPAATGGLGALVGVSGSQHVGLARAMNELTQQKEAAKAAQKEAARQTDPGGRGVG